MNRATLTLDNMLSGWACPICVLTRRDVLDFLAKHLLTWSTDDAARAELAATGGFCNQHAADVLDTASELAVAAMYRGWVRQALELAVEWRRQMERGKVEPPDAPLLSPDCLLCRVREESEKQHLTELLHRLDEERLRQRYHASRGLCLPHTRRAVEMAANEGVRRFLLDAQVTQLQRLQADLDSYQDKRRRFARHELTRAERTAWMTVIEKFASKSGQAPKRP